VTLEEYAGLKQRCAAKDYSFVAIRTPERLEFRSACSQNDVQSIETLIRLRLAVDGAARDGIEADWDAWAAFDDACWGREIGILAYAEDLLTPYLQRSGVTLPVRKAP
jgi:hypothetical protein